MTTWPALRVATGLSVGKTGIFFSQSFGELRRLMLRSNSAGWLGIGLLVFLELGLPLGVGVFAAGLDGVPVFAGLFGNVEGLVFGPAEVLLGGLDGFGAEGFAVDLVGAGLGAAVADDGADADERWAWWSRPWLRGWRLRGRRGRCRRRRTGRASGRPRSAW